MNINTHEPLDEKISEKEKALNTILARKEEELEIRLQEYLEKDYIDPIIELSLWGRDNKPARALQSYITNRESKHEEKIGKVLKKIGLGASNLIRKFDIIDSEDKDEKKKKNRYFKNLLEVADEFEIKDLGENIIDKMLSGKFKGERYERKPDETFYPDGTIGTIDLHQLMYGLFDISQDAEKVSNILKEDISHPSYSLNAYHYLCNIYPPNAITYLNDFITTYKKRDSKYFENDSSRAIVEMMKENIQARDLLLEKIEDESFTKEFSHEDLVTIHQAITEYKIRVNKLDHKKEKNTKINEIMGTLLINAEKRSNKQKTINTGTNEDKNIEIFGSRSNDQIKKRIITGLETRIYSPIDIPQDSESYPSDVMGRLLSQLKKEGKEGEMVIKRISQELTNCIQEYTSEKIIKDNEKNYFSELLGIAETYNLKNIGPYLLEKIKSGEFKNKFSGKRDIHGIIYATLGTLVNDKREIEQELINDIEIEKYASVVYPYLCEINIENCHIYLPKLIEKEKDKSSLFVKIGSTIKKQPDIENIILKKLQDEKYAHQFEPIDIETIKNTLDRIHKFLQKKQQQD